VGPGRAQLRLRVTACHAGRDRADGAAAVHAIGKKKVAVPSTVHCDHLIRAESGASEDMKRAITENNEVYNFLRSASRKYGIGFWRPAPGSSTRSCSRLRVSRGLMIGTDSHTPNAAASACSRSASRRGRGRGDGGLPWESAPEADRGSPDRHAARWTSPKDVITYLCGVLTVKGGTNKIVEYFAPAPSRSAPPQGHDLQHGSGAGRHHLRLPVRRAMATYLRATDRADVARWPTNMPSTSSRTAVLEDPSASTTRSSRSTSTNSSRTWSARTLGSRPAISRLAGRRAERLAAPDQERAHRVLHEFLIRGHAPSGAHRQQGMTAGSARRSLPDHAGLRARLSDDQARRHHRHVPEDGGTVLANACGRASDSGSARMWTRGANTIVSSFNRNFPGRNDGSGDAVVPDEPGDRHGAGVRGTLDFDPSTARSRPGRAPGALRAPRRRRSRDASWGRKGTSRRGGRRSRAGRDPAGASVCRSSSRFPLDGNDFLGLPILVKTKGKTTTTHLAAAGGSSTAATSTASATTCSSCRQRFTGETARGSTC